MGLHHDGRNSRLHPFRTHDLRDCDDLRSVQQVPPDGLRRGGSSHLLPLPGLRHADDDGGRPQVLHLTRGVRLCRPRPLSGRHQHLPLCPQTGRARQEQLKTTLGENSKIHSIRIKGYIRGNHIFRAS